VHPLNYCRAAYLPSLLILFCPVFASAAEYQVDSWTTENGLPQNIVRDVCQTPDGYLWFATMDGLVRFDGVRFVVFNRSNTPGIAGNRFSSLYCSGGGEFWAGTESSGITRYQQGRFATYTTRQGLPSNEVLDVTGDDAGHIWALSHTSIVQWSEAGSRFLGLPSEQSRYSYFSNGRFGFWGINGDGLRLFVRGQLRDYPFPRDWPRRFLTRAGKDLNGVIWLLAADGRFAKLNGGRWSKVFRVHAKQAASSKPADFASTSRDSRGNLWNFGIASHPADSLIQYLSLSVRGQPRRIPFNSFYEDREGSVWLATDGQGLYRVRKQAVSVLSKEDGLPDRNIYAIYQDRGGAIWIGTWNGGLARFSAGKFTTFSAAQGLNSSRIGAMSEDRDGVLWVATDHGLYRMQNGRFELEDYEILRDRELVRAIHQDPEGTLWFGTAQGLVRYRDRSWTVLTPKDGLASDDARVMIDGRAGNLWIGGYGGLTSLYHGHFKRWTEADGLPSNSIRSLYEDSDGVLWIGTYDGGLGRLQNGKLIRYTVRDGLFNNGVFQILEDSRGYLWMSCNRGIYRVSKSELTEFAMGKRRTISSISYGKADGMRNAECNGGLWPAGIRAHNGELWFPTQDGVVVIDPEHVTVNSRPPPVVIESISVDGQSSSPDKALRIPPGRENLEIEYTALSLIDSGQIRFKYQLVGLDRDWVDAYTRRAAYYSHLPPGEYDFRVVAANSDGVWNMDGKQVHISVLPPFYRTWWFLMIALLTAAGAVYLAWQNRVSQLERSKQVQEAFSRQLIASQEGERKRIAAELHDSLGQHLLIIKNWAALALRGLNGASVAKEPLTEISSTASQAIDEVRGIAYNLRPYQLEKLGLTTAIQDLVDQIAASSAIRFSTAVERVDGAFPKDVEISIYRMVQESLNNIVRHSQATEARVLVTRRAGLVKLIIQDNGRGFTAPSAGAPAPGRNGFGLLGIAERARMLGGHMTIQCAPDAGTTITISLKLQQAS
jgi:signal transduction histidine kinase/sugar lactone lactonase YvrE